MRKLPLRVYVSLVVTAVYLLVFGVVGYWHLQASKEQYLKTEEARLKALLQALAPTISINLQFGFVEPIKDTIVELHNQNSELLASRIVDDGEVLFEYGKYKGAISLLNSPSKRIIYTKEPISPVIAKEKGGDSYIEAIISDANYHNMLDDYYKLLLDVFLIFIVALVVINLWLGYIFRPLGKLAKAFGDYDPKSKNFMITHQNSSPEIETIAKKAQEMIRRLEDYASEIIERDREILKRLRQAQMGELLSMIAHQWRQPLSSIGTISANIQLLIELDKCSPNQVIELARKIDFHTAHLANTVSDFRNLYNPNKKPKEANLEDICHKSIALLSGTLAQENIIVEVICAFNSTVYTYPDEILQVLIALLKNSHDAIVERGVADPIITIEGKENRESFLVIVEDNAGGIDEVVFPKLFDPYFSTKDEKNGTGLGLYMAKMLIEDHCKGAIRVENSRSGALFTITIPKRSSP